MSGVAAYRGHFGAAQAERLLWRAGFGPRAGEAGAREARPRRSRRLARPPAASSSTGRRRTTTRAARSRRTTPGATTTSGGSTGWCARTQPLVERMTLIWHDWFATSNAGVGLAAADAASRTSSSASNALGSFHELLLQRDERPGDAALAQRQPTTRSESPNENYGREMLELFTLGAGARLHRERRARARARADRLPQRLEARRRPTSTSAYDPKRHDTGAKTIFGKTRQLRLAGLVPARASRIPTTRRSSSRSSGATSSRSPPDAATRAGARSSSTSQSGYEVRPVVQAILHAPRALHGPAHGQAAGRLHRRAAARARPRDRHDAWAWLARSPASGSSTRRTSPAGTTRAGSTRRRSAAAGGSRTYALDAVRARSRTKADAPCRRAATLRRRRARVLGQADRSATRRTRALLAFAETRARRRRQRRLEAAARTASMAQNALRHADRRSSPDLQTA